MRAVAACHVHSNWSYDGTWPLETLAATFARRGVSALLMTEHDRGFSAERLREYRRACADASSTDIVVIPGVEYADPANTIHVLVWGDVPFLGEGLPTAEMLRQVTGARGVAVLAHPARRNAWKLFDPAWTPHLAGIELWNRKADGWAPGRRARAMLRRTGLRAFAGIDFHDSRQMFPLTLALELAGPASEHTVLASLTSGRFTPALFGVPIQGKLVEWAAGPLRIAEFGRRSLVFVRKRVGLYRRPPVPPARPAASDAHAKAPC
jgi:hypothetical protein